MLSSSSGSGTRSCRRRRLGSASRRIACRRASWPAAPPCRRRAARRRSPSPACPSDSDASFGGLGFFGRSARPSPPAAGSSARGAVGSGGSWAGACASRLRSDAGACRRTFDRQLVTRRPSKSIEASAAPVAPSRAARRSRQPPAAGRRARPRWPSPSACAPGPRAGRRSPAGRRPPGPAPGRPGSAAAAPARVGNTCTRIFSTCSAPGPCSGRNATRAGAALGGRGVDQGQGQRQQAREYDTRRAGSTTAPRLVPVA